jgi:hypothetical protein
VRNREKDRGSREKKEKKKNLFNALADEQLLLELGELLFISFRLSAEWGGCCEVFW